MRIRNLGILALAAGCFTGCSPIDTAYPSEASAVDPKDAVLVNDDDSHIWLMSVDETRNGLPSHGLYHLLPGRHTVRVQYFWSHDYVTWTGNDLASYSFNVKEGVRLRVVCQHAEEPGYGRNYSYKGTWKFWIEDASNGDPVPAEDSGPILTREATGERTEPFFLFFQRMRM